MTDACPHCGKTVTEADMLMLDVIDFSGCPLNPPCPPRKTLQPGDAWPREPDDDDEDDEEQPEPITPKEGQAA